MEHGGRQATFLPLCLNRTEQKVYTVIGRAMEQDGNLCIAGYDIREAICIKQEKLPHLVRRVYGSRFI